MSKHANRINRIIFSAVVATGAFHFGTAEPARGAEGAQCVVAFYDVVLAPGVSGTPTSGTYSSNGKTATMDCDGTVNGKEITGTGTYVGEGRYGTDDPDTCAEGGEGTERFSITLPTAEGPEHIEGTGTFTFGPLDGGGPYSGTFTGERWSGVFELYALKGDCVTSPVTEAGHLSRGTLR